MHDPNISTLLSSVTYEPEPEVIIPDMVCEPYVPHIYMDDEGQYWDIQERKGDLGFPFPYVGSVLSGGIDIYLSQDDVDAMTPMTVVPLHEVTTVSNPYTPLPIESDASEHPTGHLEDTIQSIITETLADPDRNPTLTTQVQDVLKQRTEFLAGSITDLFISTVTHDHWFDYMLGLINQLKTHPELIAKAIDEALMKIHEIDKKYAEFDAARSSRLQGIDVRE